MGSLPSSRRRSRRHGSVCGRNVIRAPFSARWGSRGAGGMADAADAATDRLVLSSGPWPTVSTVADRSITTPLACREGRRFTTPI